MDSKISALPISTTALATDILPVVSGSSTKSISIGVLSQNMPNLGNKGITKNTVTSASSLSIPLTVTLVVLPVNASSYTLANGVSGQELILVSEGVNVVNIASGSVSTLNMLLDSVVTLLFTGTKWVIKSST